MFTVGRRFKSWMAASVLLLGLTGISMAAASKETDPAGSGKQPSSLADQVRFKLITLDNLSVFDNLEYSLKSPDTVVLTGSVVQPNLKSWAEAEVWRIPGIKEVVNNIEVMPVSPFDDSIRLRTYRAIYSNTGFEKYAVQALLPIRIIVKNGNITLEGVVGSQMDKTMAEMAARSVSDAFSVTDNLTIG